TISVRMSEIVKSGCARVLLYTFTFFFSCSGDPRDLHSFPTRRSSDLFERAEVGPQAEVAPVGDAEDVSRRRLSVLSEEDLAPCRSEEHTSELQSRENLVCRLLLEKKNTKRHPPLATPTSSALRPASIM